MISGGQTAVDLIEDLYSAWRLTKPNPNLTIIDKTRKFREPTPRSRAIAPSATEMTGGGLTRYFAQFYAGFSSDPELNQEGGWVKANLQLMETDKYGS